MKKDDKKMALGPLLVTILQSEDFTLIGEDTETLVEGNLTFVLHTQS